MSPSIEKLENPLRIQELNPEETLAYIELKNPQSFCDFGAGSGIFAFEAAKRTTSTVYAVEKSKELLAYIKDKIHNNQIKNIKCIKVKKKDVFPKKMKSVDCFFLCTVFHELEDQEDFLQNVYAHYLKDHGRLAIIEFKKEPTDFGPPLEERFTPQEINAIAKKTGFKLYKEKVLSSNFYLQVYEKEIHDE